MAQLAIEPIRVTRVATAEIFTEGPVPDGNGGILFSDIDAQKIFRYDIARDVTNVAFEDSGGANGLAIDNEGRLLAAEGIAQRLTRRGEGAYEVLAPTWNEQALNSPNDIAVDSLGGIYFTDPDYYHQVQEEGVYYITPTGEIDQILVPSDRPNGIALSPDESKLYLAIPTRNPSVGNRDMEIRQYDLELPGQPTNERDFVTETFVDGMHVDRFGNVYGATFFGFQIWDSSGNRLVNSPSPSRTTNVTLEDPFGAYPNVVYVTGGRFLYRAELTPSLTGDFNADGKITSIDIDTLTEAVDVSNRNRGFDLDDSGTVDLRDRGVWVHEVAGTFFGDSNLDGQFNAIDLVQVLQSSQFADAVPGNSDWGSGDWNGDGDFDQKDIVLALQDGGYGIVPLAANRPVPEPEGIIGLILATLLLGRWTFRTFAVTCLTVNAVLMNVSDKSPDSFEAGGM